ncbi:hypothetical protein PFICI_14880 [Pestalotiopsis fici W106-1]|uniref:Spt20-like SEP domain-containing protein n=1 Tax=Pestalotiopsis fici (strain W106-1 / CGMCC3.15140) TaxID=1229662 RepID=W3WH87_PESFW|nr:uncharacterized protein PFICI_14880 [Pestalotiopsis fici W106-1]ETS73275.1 hypothetical protein PFICI_14880 [Pestalotiopsis fici W106-1]
MAPVATSTPIPVPNLGLNTTTKIKRPPPPGIQTNGNAASSRSSPSMSPSMSAKRTPTGGNKAQPTPTPATANGAPRSASIRQRREQSIQAGLAGQRNGRLNALRSASLAADGIQGHSLEPRPEVITSQYILKKHSGSPPSLIVHLHPAHFRFDQQDSIFPYKSPMRVLLDHFRSKTLPHDILPYFIEQGVVFYDGCLIVEIHDHKSPAEAKDVARPTSASSKDTPFSIHNYTPYITPSPHAPYPKENTDPPQTSATSDNAKATDDGENKESMPAPAVPDVQKSKGPVKPKKITIVLHPTAQSLHTDLMLKATTPQGAADGNVPPTPIAAVPPTPTAAAMPPPAKKQKRERMELDGKNIHAVESQILLATAEPLHLEPTKNSQELIQLLDTMTDEKHSEDPPKPKTRKRTVAERAAEEAAAAEHEKFMLTYDERLSSTASGAQGSADGAAASGQSVPADVRFERFKVIEEIKREHAEKKEQEKARQAEQERKLALQKQEQQAQQAQLVANRQQEAAAAAAAEKARRDEAERQQRARQQQQQQQEAQRRALAQSQAQQVQAQAQAAAQAQAQATTAQSPPAMQHQLSQASHGHPTPGPMPNTLPQHRFQGVSQPPASSPVVRQNTPMNISSPMVPAGNVPMQHSNSGMGGSPARPSSVVQNHPMSAPMAVTMSARNSQQSHAAGTPRMPSATPQMPHGTPINRPMQTPRIPQASSPPVMMGQTPNMPMVGQQPTPGSILLGGQNHMQNPNFAAARIMEQQQRQRIYQEQQRALMTMQQNAMMQGQTPQQMMQMQAQQRFLAQQMAQNGNNAQMLNGNPAMGNVQMNQLQMQMQMQQQQQQQQMQNSMGNPNMVNNNAMNNMAGTNPAQLGQLNPNQIAALQAQIQQQQQQQQRAGQQQQHNVQANPMAAAMRSQNLQAAVQARQRIIYQQNVGQLVAKYGNLQSVPPEVQTQFHASCHQRAYQQVQEMVRSQQQQRQQAMLQQSMQNGMNGGMSM